MGTYHILERACVSTRSSSLIKYTGVCETGTVLPGSKTVPQININTLLWDLWEPELLKSSQLCSRDEAYI